MALSAFALLLSGYGAGEAGVDLQSRNVNGTVHGGQQPVTAPFVQATTYQTINATVL